MMLIDERRRDLLDTLLKINRTFLKLYEEHKDLDLQLRKIAKKKNLTPFEQEESNRIKRLKLFKKDMMEKIITSYESKQLPG
jgi:uncharacterized protein